MTVSPAALASFLALILAAPLLAGAPDTQPNNWSRLDKADLTRSDAPLIWESGLKRFMVLGGSIAWDGYAKPHPFDELALDLTRGEWENWIPAGKEWGPPFGESKAPTWKTGYWTTTDAEGNCRPNLIVNAGGYGVVYSKQFAYDPVGRRTWFYVRGSTLCYDAAARAWKDLSPANHPNKALGGELFWSSMCYLEHANKVLLFGGGNVQTERGDPGTWLYDPATNAWEQLRLDVQPPQRAYSSLVYDPVAKRAVLFGGDQLSQLINDTWTFDGQKWHEAKPTLAPAPRAGHALVWLPRAKKMLLLGGYGYESGWGYYPAMYRNRPMEAWTYDAAAAKWELVASWPKNAPPTCLLTQRAGMLSAAASDDDVVLVLSSTDNKVLEAWRCQIDASRPDTTDAAKLGAAPGTIERRKRFYDPQWYKTTTQPGDAEKVRAELDSLVPNTWTMRPQPNRPDIDVCWGTAVYSPDADVIMRFSGGHCVYGGTAPQVYDIKTDRWSIPYAPEMYLNFCASNMGLLDGWSFAGNPWMPGHSYNATVYDPESKCMMYVSYGHTFFFDPIKGRWTRAEKPNPSSTHQYVTTLAQTGRGMVLWAGEAHRQTALYLFDAKACIWGPIPVKGNLPMAGSGDNHGMAYDPKRDRLLFFSALDKNKGDVMAYDMKTGETRWLEAAGKERAAVGSRNALYLSEMDAVLIGNHVVDGQRKLWPLYDCQKNAWFAIDFAGDDPLVKTQFYSLAVMRDAKRKILWTVDHINRVHALKLDPDKVVLHKLE